MAAAHTTLAEEISRIPLNQPPAQDFQQALDGALTPIIGQLNHIQQNVGRLDQKLGLLNERLEQNTGRLDQNVGLLNGRSEQNMGRIDHNLGLLNGRFDQLLARFNLSESMSLIRLTNAQATGPTALLVYPAGIDTNLVPLSQDALIQMTAAQCQTALDELGIQPFTDNPTVEEMRRLVANYLGSRAP